MTTFDAALHTPSLKEAAVAYTALGWPVFPLLARSKQPLTPHGVKDSSTDPQRVAAWFVRSPEPNIGLDCGGAGLVVVDVDAAHGGLESWARLDPHIPTLSSRTGGGGLHLLYRASADPIRNSAGKLGPGIDVRAAGGYIVLPPSVHPNGSVYRWESILAPAPFPDAIAALLLAATARPPQQAGPAPAPAQSTRYGLAALRDETDRVRQALPGTRNDVLNRAAFALGQLVASGDLCPTVVETSLLAAALQAGLAQPEARKTLGSAFRAGQLEPRAYVRSTSCRAAGRVPDGAVPPRPDGVREQPHAPHAAGHTSPAIPRLSAEGNHDVANGSPPASAPDDPPGSPGSEYLILDGAIVRQRQTTQGLITTRLCNFSAAIGEELASDDGEQIKRLLTISGATATGQPLPTARVDADEFSRMRWVTQHWGTRAVIYAGQGLQDHLRAAIQLLSPASATRHVYTHTGWRLLDGHPVFLTGGEVIGAESDRTVRPGPDALAKKSPLSAFRERGQACAGALPAVVRASLSVSLEREMERYALPTPPRLGSPELRAAVQASMRFLDVAPYAVTIPLWAGMFLAPLSDIIPPRFALWLYGVTGSMKSTLAALALNHYGDWTADDLIMWSATANALEKFLFLAKDVPFVVDDFAPQTDRVAATKLETVAAHVVRDVGNRAGRARMNSDLSLRTVYRPRGLLISTGEQLPDGQSVLARLVTVEVRRPNIALDALNRAQAERGQYAIALAGYIVWLAPQLDALRRSLPLQVKGYRELARAEGQHLRLPEALASLYAGWALGLRFAVACGALDEELADFWRTEGWRIFIALGRSQAELTAGEQPVARYLSILGELLAQGKLRLAPLRGGEASALEGSSGDGEGELIGWQDEHYLYLLPGASYHRVAQYARDEGRHFGIKEQALRKALAEEGLLEGDEGRHTARIRIDGRQQRLLQIRRERVEKVWAIP